MPIKLQCPGCQKELKCKDELAGRRIKCPGCGQICQVPSSAGTPPAAPASPADTTPAAEGNAVWWKWFAGAGIAVLLLVGLLVFAMSGNKAPAPDAAASAPQDTGPATESEPADETDPAVQTVKSGEVTVSIGRDTFCRSLNPQVAQQSGKETDVVEVGDFKGRGGKRQTKGVWTSSFIYLDSLTLLDSASIWGRVAPIGGPNIKSYKSSDNSRLLNVAIKIEVPNGAEVVDVSSVTLTAGGETYPPVAFGPANDSLSSTDFDYSHLEDGLCIQKMYERNGTRTIYINNKNNIYVPPAMIYDTSQEKPLRKISIQFIFRVPASTRSFRLSHR